MFKGKIAIKYNSDWSNDLIDEFNCDMSFIYTQNIDANKVIDLVKIPLNKKLKVTFSEVKQFLSKYKYLKDVEFVDENSNYILFKTLTDMSSLSNNQYFVKNFCFQIGQIKVIDKYEIWEFFTPNKNNIKNILKELNKLEDREVKLLGVSKYNLKFQDLTEKQYFYLEYLNQKGYFEIPKKITLEEAAKKLKTTSTNINKHVNRAIKKLVMKILSE